ncbi:MAG: hypothetical protein WDA65_01525 [Christensenellales bacterium]
MPFVRESEEYAGIAAEKLITVGIEDDAGAGRGSCFGGGAFTEATLRLSPDSDAARTIIITAAAATHETVIITRRLFLTRIVRLRLRLLSTCARIEEDSPRGGTIKAVNRLIKLERLNLFLLYRVCIAFP